MSTNSCDRAVSDHHNFVAGDVPGHLVQAGHIDQVSILSTEPVRSHYREQVLQIAPHELIGRDAELAEIARFCAEDATLPCYLWWQAEAWAGKSALLAWFVLNSPPTVQVVSFFITARFAGHDTRDAFIEQITEQLATLLNRPLPPMLTDTNRDSHLRGMLRAAADHCHERGQRLVLVVDGLDEDRGVALGSTTYSIAGILPAAPIDGLRIIVSGRPHPGIPSDVPDHHPLRDPIIVRQLTPSPAAQAARATLERELDALVGGTDDDRTLLGLIIASGGGLSSQDLAELTDQPYRQIDKHLNSVAGRSFTRRPAHWHPGRSPDVYILAHDNLLTAATDAFNQSQLQHYHERLRHWAQQYQQQRWPPGTPEYLLRGYFSTLTTTGDIDAMVAYATDTARHDRLRHVSGGDTTALGEITGTQDALYAASEPDPLQLITVTIHGENLIDRNARIPTRLPALWARLGNLNRAEALAEAITGTRQDTAVDDLIRALVRTDNIPRAQALALRRPQQNNRDHAIATLAAALARTDHLDQAEHHIRMILDAGHRAGAVSALVAAIGRTGDLIRAEAATRLSTDPRYSGWVITNLAVAVAATGNIDRALALISDVDNTWWPPKVLIIEALATVGKIDQADTLLDTIIDPAERNVAITALIEIAAETANTQRAQDLAGRAATDDSSADRVIAALACALGAAGDFDQARDTINQVGDDGLRGSATADLIRVLAAAGKVDEAELLARSLLNDNGGSMWKYDELRGLLAVVRALGVSGEIDRARALIQAIPNSPRALEAARPEALTALAEGTYARGDTVLATSLADEAEHLARTICASDDRIRTMAGLTAAVVAAGDMSRAEALAQLVLASTATWITTATRSHAIRDLAQLLSPTGDPDLVERLARAIENPADRAAVLTTLACRARINRDHNRSRQLANYARSLFVELDIQKNIWRNLHTQLIGVVVAAGKTGQALDMHQEMLPKLLDERQRGMATTEVIVALCAAGEVDRAEALMTAITDDNQRVRAATALAEAVAKAGDIDRAQAIANAVSPQWQRDQTLLALAKTIAAVGAFDQAETIATAIASAHQRVRAYLAVAEHADPGHQRQLLAKAMQTNHWSDTAEILTKQHPASLLQLVDMCIDLWTSRTVNPDDAL